MKNTFGNQVSITLFGESHGAAIGAVLDGLAPGIPVDEDEIRHALSLFHAGKIRQQHSVRTKPEAIPALNDAQAVSL